MWWQYGISYLCTHFPRHAGRLLSPRPLVLAFRGEMLMKAMKTHRVSKSDLYSALRAKGVWNLCEVELVVIEPNGLFSIYLRKDFPENYVRTTQLSYIVLYCSFTKLFVRSRICCGTLTDIKHCESTRMKPGARMIRIVTVWDRPKRRTRKARTLTTVPWMLLKQCNESAQVTNTGQLHRTK